MSHWAVTVWRLSMLYRGLEKSGTYDTSKERPHLRILERNYKKWLSPELKKKPKTLITTKGLQRIPGILFHVFIFFLSFDVFSKSWITQIRILVHKEIGWMLQACKMEGFSLISPVSMWINYGFAFLPSPTELICCWRLLYFWYS